MDNKKPFMLGLYEKALPGHLDWEEKLRLCREFGFDWLEISIDESDARLSRLDWTREERNALRKQMEKTGVPIETMCLSGHRKFPLGASDRETEERSLEIMEKAVDLAADLGIRLIQLAGYDVYYETGTTETRERFERNLALAVDMAARRGVLLGFETMETPFMDTVEKAMVYVEKENSPYLGVYPDIGNLTNAAELYGNPVSGDLKRGRGHILAAHLKETVTGRYREIPFGQGHTDFVSCIRTLREMGVRRFTGEFWYVGQESWKEDCRAASAFLRSKLAEAFG